MEMNADYFEGQDIVVSETIESVASNNEQYHSMNVQDNSKVKNFTRRRIEDILAERELYTSIREIYD